MDSTKKNVAYWCYCISTLTCHFNFNQNVNLLTLRCTVSYIKTLSPTYSVDIAWTSSSVCFPFSANLDRFLRSRIFFLSLSSLSFMISTLLGWMPTLTVAPLAFSLWILSMWMTCSSLKLISFIVNGAT